MKANPTRQGFLILIMIAFASILLGLATTFFIYCSKCLESSGDAVRYAQSRIALHGALNYVFKTLNQASDSTVLNTLFPATGIISFDSSEGNPRAIKMGYARIAPISDSFTTYGARTLDLLDGFDAPNTAPTSPPGPVTLPNEPPADILFNITVGCGPSQGATTVTSPLEVRRIYKLTVNITQCGTPATGAAALGNGKMIKMTLDAPYTSLPSTNW